jgi:hypothetical protein
VEGGIHPHDDPKANVLLGFIDLEKLQCFHRLFSERENGFDTLLSGRI